MAILEAKPAAVATPISAPRATTPNALNRTHRDRRHWICVSPDADVPAREVERLAEHSYELVCSGLTRKQQADLAGSSRPKAR